MGIFTVAMTNGAHISPIIGGLIGQYCGWRWIFKFAAILDGLMLLTTIIFFLPETLYVRESLTPANMGPSTTRLNREQYINRLRLWTSYPSLKLQGSHFVIPTLKMMKYPSVIFPALYLSSQYGFASILPAVTVAHIFTKYFGWSTMDIGIAYGAALTIGGSLGELAAGIVVDGIVKRERRKLGGRDPEPEVRLKAIWTGEILEPIGLLIYGFTLQDRMHWMGPLFGMGLASFGVQIILTTCYTYSVDCYRDRNSDVSQVFNFWRQEVGMTFAFYVIDWAEVIGYQFVFLFFAIVGSLLAFIPILVLMWKGKDIRERLGSPGQAISAVVDGAEEK
ncbi:MFS general substrate transporter [Neofusicoccum parvum]|uniref:MFS general substrate transporter n=1 Tax=Neofusicoccum parvum TaxID=310453 RepID=A0ACB5SP95_9PEZI|nr:MFS general substrate transporter [Neofusicoccum parvum]